jgi:hypothetical protein
LGATSGYSLQSFKPQKKQFKRIFAIIRARKPFCNITFMKKITLELVFKIIGIGSASGLLYNDNTLLIVGDNSGFLYEYNMDNAHLISYPLMDGASENIAKSEKPDFESLTLYQDTVYIFSSGSTSKRNTMVEFDLNQKKKIVTNNLVDLYAVMQSFGNINPEDFNLEGAIYDGQIWYLLNRGNGISNKNTLFSLQAKKLSDEFSLLSNDYKLPKIKGVRSSFTDAVLLHGKIYFLATAENTESTYADGEILGSHIGCINLETMKIEFTKKISDSHKFEGITVFKDSNKSIEFLLCEDKDTDVLETDIYKLTLDLK